MSAVNGKATLIAHIVFRFDYGGLENGVVNLINGLPHDEFRHVVIALTSAGEFRRRIMRTDVEVYELHKRPGYDLAMYLRLLRLLRRIAPDVVHTRNFGTLDCQPVAWLAGVRTRVHGEHGWDIHDPDGIRFKYQFLRRLLAPWVTHFVTVSRELETWLIERCGIAARRVSQIYNGVDAERFSCGEKVQHAAAGRRLVRIGTVTRFQPIKDPLNLVNAFLIARRESCHEAIDLRLAMVGDGELRADAASRVADADEIAAVEFLGAREDVPALLSTFDVFALGSLREGISNTILEAMACGVPVVASRVGGNIEVVDDGVTGCLVPPADPQALAAALLRYARDPELRRTHGENARQRAQGRFSLTTMLTNYTQMYRSVASSMGSG